MKKINFQLELLLTCTIKRMCHINAELMRQKGGLNL